MTGPSRPGLQSRVTGIDTATVPLREHRPGPTGDHAAGEIGEDRCQDCQPWPVRHVPIGRGGGAEKLVPENLGPD